MDLDTALENFKRHLSTQEQLTSQELKGYLRKSEKMSFRFFLISFLEFATWAFLNFILLVFFQDDIPKSFSEFPIIGVIEKINLVVTALFVALFFYRFKKISTTYDLSEHINSKIKLKVLTYIYVQYNLFVFSIVFLLSCFWEINNNSEISILLKDNAANYLIAYLICFALCLLFIYLIKYLYKFLFGKHIIQLKKLRWELKKTPPNLSIKEG